MTGNQIGAGTPEAGVYVTLVGSKGHSGKIFLQSFLKIMSKKYLGRETCDNVILESNGDFGEVEVVILGIDKGRRSSIIHDPWYVNYVGVFNYQTKQIPVVFPCYYWIGNGDSVSFTAHTSKFIPEVDDALVATYYLNNMVMYFKVGLP